MSKREIAWVVLQAGAFVAVMLPVLLWLHNGVLGPVMDFLKAWGLV